MVSDSLNRSVRLRVSTNALKTVDHRGGLDAFLAKARDEELSPKALELKRELRKKRAAPLDQRATSVNCSRIVRWIGEKLSSETSVKTRSPCASRLMLRPSILSI